MQTTSPRDENRDLIDVLEPALGEYFGRTCSIRRIERTLSDYRSSFALEDLRVEFADGRWLPMMFKDLSPRALLEEARRIRSPSLGDPAREIRVYRHLLSEHPLGTATCYAASIDPQHDRYWLFLEKVQGLELYKVGEFSVWEQVAGWLARFHNSGRLMGASAREAQLQEWNRERYHAALDQARACQELRSRCGQGGRDVIERVSRVYDHVVDRLSVLPQAVIHGEFYASNVLVQHSPRGLRVCPVDWETAGIGPGIIDLAALVAGGWTDQQRNSLAQAYWGALGETQRAAFERPSTFYKRLLACRLVLAVQLLGHTPHWEPPTEHRQDWLHEADVLASSLEP